MYRESTQSTTNCDLNEDHQEGSRSASWKLIDFGLLLNLKQCRDKGMRYKGTRGWTPPETNPYSNNNRYSESKDIWALGLLILYIVLGQQPYTTTGYEQQELCK